MANEIELPPLELNPDDENGGKHLQGQLGCRERQLLEALATIADLRRQLEEALKTSAGWKMCADKCNQEFALAAVRDAAIKEAGFAEGIRKAAEVCAESDGWDMHPKDYYSLVLSLLPKPTEPSAGGAE